MVSRITLAVQYLSIIWHVRSYPKTRLPLGIMVGANFVTAMIYLGITFSFGDDNSNIYLAWYILGGIELLFQATVSLFWKVLSFEGTHLINRMSLLTFIIIGEGIIVVCGQIAAIVKNPNSWSKLPSINRQWLR